MPRSKKARARAKKLAAKNRKANAVNKPKPCPDKKSNYSPNAHIENKNNIDIDKRIEEILKSLWSMWTAIKKKFRNEKFMESFNKLTLEKKMDYFMPSYKELCTDYPIQTKMMICRGQYKHKAARKYLNKYFKTVHPVDRKPGYVEDQWIWRNAEYVMWVYQESTPHYNNAESLRILNQSYDTLRGTMDKFKNDVKSIQARIKKQENAHLNELSAELYNRVIDPTQHLSDEAVKDLITATKSLIYKNKTPNKPVEEKKSTVPITMNVNVRDMTPEEQKYAEKNSATNTLKDHPLTVDEKISMASSDLN